MGNASIRNDPGPSRDTAPDADSRDGDRSPGISRGLESDVRQHGRQRRRAVGDVPSVLAPTRSLAGVSSAGRLKWSGPSETLSSTPVPCKARASAVSGSHLRCLFCSPENQIKISKGSVGSRVRTVSSENEGGELRVETDERAASRRSRAERRSQAGRRPRVRLARASGLSMAE